LWQVVYLIGCEGVLLKFVRVDCCERLHKPMMRYLQLWPLTLLGVRD
jgi:hypothetical protein